MQFLGWMSIAIGLLHFGRVVGILLFLTGTAVVYVVRKSKINEIELARMVFRRTIRRTRRVKKNGRAITDQEIESDFLTNALRMPSNTEPEHRNTHKSDWFFYKN